ncbi:hypothetical protein CLAIMM_03320 [Cladophialophora immunda]|nr:hypothetical protein CLAIMM_03320 [Cladophialophora immunda]
MRAARYHGRRDVRIESIPVPEPGPGECLIEVEWCGICGTDLHEYLAGPFGIPTKDRPDPLTGGTMPVTIGHEFCGRVKTAPPGSNLKEGQPVMVDPHVQCRKCLSCTSGYDHLCDKLAFIGNNGGSCGGGLAEFVTVNSDHVHPLPENVSLDFAALIEPLVVGYHATQQAGVGLEGKSILILGAGPIGIALISNLRACGVKQILLSEPTAKRSLTAKDLVERIIDPRSENVGDVCRQRTDNKGVDVVFDCAGVQVAMDAGLDALSFKGTYVNIAQWEKPFSVNFRPFFLKEIKIASCCCYNDKDFSEVMELVRNDKFPAYKQMVTKRIALEDLVSSGLEELINHKDDHIKILISPKLKAGQ